MVTTAYKTIMQKTDEFSDKIAYFLDNLEEILDSGDKNIFIERENLFSLGRELGEFVSFIQIEANNDNNSYLISKIPGPDFYKDISKDVYSLYDLVSEEIARRIQSN